MSGIDIRPIRGRSRSCRSLMLLWGLFVLNLVALALPRAAMAAYYYGPPYKMNVMGAIGSFNTVSEAVNQSVAVASQFCHSPCTVMVKYNDPNGSSWAGTAAFIYYSTSPESPWYVDATQTYANPVKLTGGSCAGGNGGAGLGSSPANSSGDSAQDTAGRCPSTFEADPINTANGNKYQEDTDFRAPEWLTFRRFYNSKIGVAAAEMGPQWRHTFDRSLEVLLPSATATGVSMAFVYRPDGGRVQFNKKNGSWVADPDVIDTLIEADDALGNPTGYTYFVGAAKQFEQYSATGLLQSITDEAGLSVTLAYSTTDTPATVAPKPGLLTTVTDPKGRTLSFTYDSAGHVHTVTLPDGAPLTYGYDGTMLTSVTYPDGRSRQYIYNEQSLTSGTNIPTALTGVVDEKGVRFENTGYESSGKAISSSFAGGADATKVSYYNFTSYGTVPATLTTPLGTTMDLGFTNVLGSVKPDGASKPCGNQCNRPWWDIFYDTNGRPSSFEDFYNNVTATTFNSSGLETQRIEAKGTTIQRTTNTTWDNVLRNPLTRSVLDAAGNQVAYQSWTYNSRGQVVAACDADPSVSGAVSYACGSATTAPSGARQTTRSYCDASGSSECPLISLPLSVTDPRGNTTRYTYYSSSSTQGCGTPGSACYRAGDLYQVIDALGHTMTVVSYDAVGRPTRITDANGVITDVTYTPRGWVDSRTVAGAKTSYAYDKVGAVTSVTDADGVVISYGYDDAHRLTRITDALGNYIQYTLDASGNRTAENVYAAGSSAPSRTLTRKFNALGQLAQELDAQNRAITFTYDKNGDLTDIKDRLNIITHTVYDAMRRVASTTQNYNGTDAATKNTLTAVTYDALGRTAKITDPDGLLTSYTYDSFGDLTSLVSPDTGASSYLYDAAGNRIQATDARGVVSHSTYDALNRIITTTYPDSAANVSYRYDEPDSSTGCTGSHPIGRLTSVVEAAVSTTYCYDARGNVVQKRQTLGASVDTISYTYTLGDRLASIATPDGTLVQYVRDATGRINSVRAQPPGASGLVNLVTGVAYLPFGPVASYTLGNGQAITRSYDSNYWLTDVVSPILNLHFARDAMGNITALGGAPGANPATETYHYDPLYRLSSINNSAGVATESYSYSKTGDRLSKTASGLATGTYGYQTGTHWLTTIGNSARAYDANGNTTGYSTSGDAFGYGYNGRNRLAVVQESSQTVATYTYNALGERIAKTATAPQAVNVRFVYDEGSQLLGEYGATNRNYVWMGDLPVAAIDTQGTAATVNYVHADGLGTPRAVTDNAGSIQWQWPYLSNAFGEQPPSSTLGYVFNLRFAGQYYDAESKFSYNINRYYDPSTARYTQSDPLGLQGGLATFTYVSSQPLGSTDPLGLEEAEELDLVNRVERERWIEVLGLRLGPNQANQAIESEANIRAREELAGKPCVSPANQSRGGVYRLIDPKTGETVRTGRTNDLARRQAEHGRDPVLGKYDFDVLFKTDVYDEQRGLEHEAYEAYDAPLNYVRPIGWRNPNRSRYLQAADDYLIRAASGQK